MFDAETRGVGGYMLFSLLSHMLFHGLLYFRIMLLD